ncbi:carboxymuconolactone decarboxylase family protein [Alteribacter natronophilus]|uniref:carboxymuconolactone decarboxylase family protein n=1 Tax=Alteribacter natronophilus TaxID=2583810 RepID=UPI00110EF026|nr:carboxymuconolactone decarboxylase family protein [Alteribacter natronophilus]TMW72866.1 alkylhydroperoxidase [Alteribacter natronophilus]
MSDDHLYKLSHFERIGELRDLAPEQVNAFLAFDEKALAPGELSVKTKELIAVAVAHVTGCAYCIEVHTGKAKQEASKEEVAEAIMVATALKAGSAAAHAVNAYNSFDGRGSDEMFKASYFERMREVAQQGGEAFEAFMQFDRAAMKGGAVDAKEKELIAIAVAHVTGCPYCIHVHTMGAKEKGITTEELTESVMVATALKAGSAMAHGVNALNAYDR